MEPSFEAPGSKPEPAVASPVEPEPAVVNPLLDPVVVAIDETVKANLQLEGGLTGEAECLGQFLVTVIDVSKGDLCCFKLSPMDQQFKYKVHPNLNKASQANSILEVRDATKSFKANMP